MQKHLKRKSWAAAKNRRPLSRHHYCAEVTDAAETETCRICTAEQQQAVRWKTCSAGLALAVASDLTWLKVKLHSLKCCLQQRSDLRLIYWLYCVLSSTRAHLPGLRTFLRTRKSGATTAGKDAPSCFRAGRMTRNVVCWTVTCNVVKNSCMDTEMPIWSVVRLFLAVSSEDWDAAKLQRPYNFETVVRSIFFYVGIFSELRKRWHFQVAPRKPFVMQTFS